MINKKLWGDPEIGGRLYLQFCELDKAVKWQDKVENDAVWEVVFSCMHKLTFVAYHKDNYIRLEKVKFNEAKTRLKKHKSGLAVEINEEFEMIAELEAFLHQVKSSLDMLTKILIYTAGLGLKASETFGEKGDRVIRKLKVSPLYKSGQCTSKIDELIKLIEDDRDSWLKTIINFRDTISHRRVIKDLSFGYMKLDNGTLFPTYPTFNKQRIPEFLQLIYGNLVCFHQDFLAMALRLKLFPGLDLIPLKPEEGEAHYNHPTGAFVKWGLGMKTTVSQSQPVQPV